MPKYHYAAAVLLAATVSCAKSGGTDEEPLTPASRVVPADEAQGEEDLGDAQQCQGTEDCPQGYACGFDPGRSHVVRYCMAE